MIDQLLSGFLAGLDKNKPCKISMTGLSIEVGNVAIVQDVTIEVKGNQPIKAEPKIVIPPAPQKALPAPKTKGKKPIVRAPKIDRAEYAQKIARIVYDAGDDKDVTKRELAEMLEVAPVTIDRIIKDHKHLFEVEQGVVLLTVAGYELFNPTETE